MYSNGNAAQVTLDGTVLFSYHDNTFDRLVQVDDVNGAALGRYYYDPPSTALRTGFGRRLWKQAGDQTTLFFYSDEGLVAEYDPTGAEIRSYGYRPDATWTTDPLWLQQDGEYYFYHNDHLGTPRKLVQQNGAVVWSASYTAFGQATIEVETVTNNLRFPGQYYDAETGLHYNYHRYYDLETGRYCRIDPIGFWSRDNNLYRYVLNNSIKFFDPKGLYNPYDLYFGPRRLNGGNNSLNRTLSELERRFPRKIPKNNSFYGGGEVHAIVGFGATTVICCDLDNRARRFDYFKICIGFTLGASASGGIVRGMDGKDCYPDRYRGWFFELSVGVGPVSVGGDIGLGDRKKPNIVGADAYPPDPGMPTGVNEFGGGFGVGALIKVSLCRYYYIGESKAPRCTWCH